MGGFMPINKLCHRCRAYLRPVEGLHGWLGCSCGTRRRDKPVITLEQYITASGKYKERINDPELTEEVKDNAVILLNKVNQLLEELKITKVTVSSGFRPSAVNAATKGSAKKSLHMTGMAVDLADPKNEIGRLILTRPDLLKKYGLWLEDIASTPTWCHLDCSTARKDRDLRVFKV
jgi:hypothetical protein